DLRQLINRKKVVPGQPAKSKLFRRLTSGDNPMPPEEEKPRPSKDDIAIVKQWIDMGAPDVGPAAVKRKYVSPAEIVRAICADLEKVAERDRRFTRYFTITHLYNAGLSADQLQSHRHGLSKLVNSLSWGRKITVPRPIDAERTIVRIDLRDYQWNEGVWEAIVGRNPYGVTVTD